jgi:hypothetical protein
MPLREVHGVGPEIGPGQKQADLVRFIEVDPSEFLIPILTAKVIVETAKDDVRVYPESLSDLMSISTTALCFRLSAWNANSL